jgi:hypothetical protein
VERKVLDTADEDEVTHTYAGERTDNLNNMAYLGTAPKKGQFFNRFDEQRDKQDSEFVKRFLDVTRHSVNHNFDEEQEEDDDMPQPMISPVNKESITSPKSTEQD